MMWSEREAGGGTGSWDLWWEGTAVHPADTSHWTADSSRNRSDFGREGEHVQQKHQPESKHQLRRDAWGRGFGSCGFVVAGRNASNFLALFLPRILAL